MNLLKIGLDGDVSNYITNSEWTLVNMHVERHVVYYSCCAEPYPDITYTPSADWLATHTVDWHLPVDRRQTGTGKLIRCWK